MITVEEVKELIQQCDNAIIAHGKSLEALRPIAIEAGREKTAELVMMLAGEIEWFSMQREIWKDLLEQMNNMPPAAPPTTPFSTDPILN